MSEYQNRYIAYCNVPGITPEATLKRDRALYPGGLMCGYICWIQDQLLTWKLSVNKPSNEPMSPNNHDDFDRWLTCHYPSLEQTA